MHISNSCCALENVISYPGCLRLKLVILLWTLLKVFCNNGTVVPIQSTCTKCVYRNLYSTVKQTLLCLSFMSNSSIYFSQFNVDRANSEEFYEVYKGVVTEYPVSINTALLCSHSEYLHHSFLLIEMT